MMFAEERWVSVSRVECMQVAGAPAQPIKIQRAAAQPVSLAGAATQEQEQEQEQEGGEVGEGINGPWLAE